MSWLDALFCRPHSRVTMLLSYGCLMMLTATKPVPTWVKITYGIIGTIWVICAKEDNNGRGE